jgi:hypothetical protein
VLVCVSRAASAEEVSKTQQAEAHFLFCAIAFCDEAHHSLAAAFEATHADASPRLNLVWAFNWLWPAAITAFRASNALPLPAREVPPASSRAGPRGGARGVAAYKMGWAIKKELQHFIKLKATTEVLLLGRLLQPEGVALPEDDFATAYVLAREQFGALLRVLPELTTLITHVEHELHSRLTIERIVQCNNPNHVYQTAAREVRNDAGVRRGLRKLLLGSSGGGASAATPAAPANAAPANAVPAAANAAPAAAAPPSTAASAAAAPAAVFGAVREPPPPRSPQSQRGATRQSAVDEPPGGSGNPRLRKAPKRLATDAPTSGGGAGCADKLPCADALEMELAYEEEIAAEVAAAAAAAEVEAAAAEREAGLAAVGGRPAATTEAEEIYEEVSSESDASEVDEGAAGSAARSERAVAEQLIDRLLTRLFSSGGKELQQRVLTIIEAAKSGDAVALRTKLKVAQAAQVKSISVDDGAPATINVTRGDLHLPRNALFELLLAVATEAEEQLLLLKVQPLKQLIQACHESNATIDVKCLTAAPRKPVLVEALAAGLRACAESGSKGGFLRPEALTLDDFSLRTARATVAQVRP